MDLVTGNARDAETQGTGWLIGFSPWTLLDQPALRHVPSDRPVTGLCVKWFDHASGHESGNAKPSSKGRTISILVSDDAEFHLDFSVVPDFDAAQSRTVVLRRHGDYAAWGDGLFHRWRCVSRSTILTIRWDPVG
jgi:hypothetical protein